MNNNCSASTLYFNADPPSFYHLRYLVEKRGILHMRCNSSMSGHSSMAFVNPTSYGLNSHQLAIDSQKMTGNGRQMQSQSIRCRASPWSSPESTVLVLKYSLLYIYTPVATCVYRQGLHYLIYTIIQMDRKRARRPITKYTLPFWQSLLRVKKKIREEG